MNNLSIIENGLIPVYQSDKGTKLVNMRELHAWLNVGRDFTTWIKDKIEKYEFVENQDYILTLTKTGERQNVIQHDYIFKLEPAKEIAMVENNEKGKEIRRYFIKVEDKFRSQQIDISRLSPELQMVTHLLAAASKLEAKVERLETTTQNIKDTMAELPKDQWRKWVNASLGEIGIKLGNKGQNHEDLRSDSYKMLEQKAGADLSTRLRNDKRRLEDAGATKTAQREYCKLDCIDEEKRLKEIYTGIIRELRIKYLA
jgi:phage anti-repressor protein/ribosome-associated translation inhibitor RaiA